jgi:hypothetical protein
MKAVLMALVMTIRGSSDISVSRCLSLGISRFDRYDGSSAPCASIAVSAQTDRYRFCYIPFQPVVAFRRGRKRRRLRQQRCLEGRLATGHVSYGRQRGAPRRVATFHHATLRVATHRYATLEPLGKPGGSRAFSADGPPSSASAPRRLSQPAGG